MKRYIAFFIVIVLIGSFFVHPSNLKSIQFYSFLNSVKDNEIYNVIVVFNDPAIVEYKSTITYKLLSLFKSDEEKSYSESMAKRHEKYSSILSSFGAKKNLDFIYAINGMSLTVKGSDLKSFSKLEFVKGIYPEKTYSLERDITRKVIRADIVNLSVKDPNNNLVTGIGMKVGIIDTGVDYTHKELGGGKFPNSKVVGGYDFADNDPDPMDVDGHGTHVAGIVAGSNLGIAKDAKIYAYKVFSKGSNTTTSSLIIKALDQAIKDKCDVVNISIGLQNGGATSDDPESVAVRNAVNGGVVVVAAAGNSGVKGDKIEYPISSPASVDLAIGVGASDDGITGIVYSGGRKILGQYPNESPKFSEGSYDVVYCGYGTKDDFKNKNVKGKIALIERGQIYFGDKDLNAKDAGAVGVIVYNNVSGMPKITLISQDNPSRSDFIPFLFVSFTDGQFLKSHLSAKVNITNEYSLGLIAEFSSAGPTSDFYLKPDLVAPGTNINSTYLGNSYVEMSGTSMASPVVAGCAALLKQAKPNLTTQEIKYLLMNTADILYNPVSNLPFSPTLQGSGRVNILSAVNSNAIIYPGALIFGNGVTTKSFNITIKNMQSNSKTFSTSILNASNGKVSIDIPKTITVKSNSTTNVTLNLTAIDTNADAYGFIFFDSGFEKLHIPFVYLKDNEPKDDLYEVSLDSPVVSKDGLIRLNFSVGKGSLSNAENYEFNESVAEEVKVSIFDSKGNLVKEIFDAAPIFVGDYSIVISPFDATLNEYLLKNGVYIYKVSYLIANSDEKSKAAYPVIEKSTVSGKFEVTGFTDPIASIILQPSNGYTLALNKGMSFSVDANVNLTLPTTEVSFNLIFDSTKLSLSSINSNNPNLSVTYSNIENGVSFDISSNVKFTNFTLRLSFVALENGAQMMFVANPLTSENERFFVRGVYYEISDYSRIADFNKDKKVDSLDLEIFRKTFNLSADSPNFDPRCDLNFDGVVNEIDFYIFGKHYGEIYP